MVGADLSAMFERPQGRLAKYKGLTPEEWEGHMQNISRAWTRGSGQRAMGLAGRSGMVDPYALSAQQLPLHEEIAEMSEEAKAEDEQRRYEDMIERARRRAARMGQFSAILSGVGTIIGGATGGMTGAVVGGAAGGMVGAFT